MANKNINYHKLYYLPKSTQSINNALDNSSVKVSSMIGSKYLSHIFPEIISIIFFKPSKSPRFIFLSPK